MASVTKPRLVYFNSRGLAEIIRVILHEKGVDYEDVGFESGKEQAELAKLREQGKLMFDQVPLWEEPSGLVLVQSSAIVRHLARTHSLYGRDEQEASVCDALWEYSVDLRNSGGQISRAQDPVKKEELKKNFLEVEIPKVLNRLENILKKTSTGYLVGNSLTYVDLAWWYYIESFTDQGIVDVSKHEHLSKFKASIEARPNIVAYRTNPKRHPIQWMFPRYVMHCYENASNAHKALIAGAFGGIKIEYPKFNFGVDNKTPEFLKKNPNGEVPVLDSPDGPIFESNAIAKYVARKGQDKGLYGSNEYEASVIDQWAEWVRSKLEKPVGAWMYPIYGWEPFNEERYVKAKADVAKYLSILNQHLENKEWIVGKRITLIDIIIFCSLKVPFETMFDPAFLHPFPHLVSWFKRCNHEPHVHAVIGAVTLCDRERATNELKEG